MSRHTFRPAGPDALEGRLAPGSLSPGSVSSLMTTTNSVYASNTASPSALAAEAAAAAKHARAAAAARASSHSNSINWNSVGNQLKTVFGLIHSSSKPAKSQAPTTTPAHFRTLLRS